MILQSAVNLIHQLFFFQFMHKLQCNQVNPFKHETNDMSFDVGHFMPNVY